jgi:hypothetical protein
MEGRKYPPLAAGLFDKPSPAGKQRREVEVLRGPGTIRFLLHASDKPHSPRLVAIEMPRVAYDIHGDIVPDQSEAALKNQGELAVKKELASR